MGEAKLLLIFFFKLLVAVLFEFYTFPKPVSYVFRCFFINILFWWTVLKR